MGWVLRERRGGGGGSRALKGGVGVRGSALGWDLFNTKIAAAANNSAKACVCVRRRPFFRRVHMRRGRLSVAGDDAGLPSRGQNSECIVYPAKNAWGGIEGDVLITCAQGFVKKKDIQKGGGRPEGGKFRSRRKRVKTREKKRVVTFADRGKSR